MQSQHATGAKTHGSQVPSLYSSAPPSPVLGCSSAVHVALSPCVINTTAKAGPQHKTEHNMCWLLEEQLVTTLQPSNHPAHPQPLYTLCALHMRVCADRYSSRFVRLRRSHLDEVLLRDGQQLPGVQAVLQPAVLHHRHPTQQCLEQRGGGTQVAAASGIRRSHHASGVPANSTSRSGYRTTKSAGGVCKFGFVGWGFLLARATCQLCRFRPPADTSTSVYAVRGQRCCMLSGRPAQSHMLHYSLFTGFPPRQAGVW